MSKDGILKDTDYVVPRKKVAPRQVVDVSKSSGKSLSPTWEFFRKYIEPDKNGENVECLFSLCTFGHIRQDQAFSRGAHGREDYVSPGECRPTEGHPRLSGTRISSRGVMQYAQGEGQGCVSTSSS